VVGQARLEIRLAKDLITLNQNDEMEKGPEVGPLFLDFLPLRRDSK
jgi:hypothetical protein